MPCSSMLCGRQPTKNGLQKMARRMIILAVGTQSFVDAWKLGEHFLILPSPKRPTNDKPAEARRSLVEARAHQCYAPCSIVLFSEKPSDLFIWLSILCSRFSHKTTFLDDRTIKASVFEHFAAVMKAAKAN